MKVLITGAARGLGIALTEMYAKNDHEVIAAARNLGNAEALLAAAKKYQGITVCEMDVASYESVKECKRQLEMKFNNVDLIINNAGVLYESDKTNRIMKVDVEVLRMTMAVNVEGPILVLKTFYTWLKKSCRPKYYVITSESTLEESWYGIPVYSLSKVAANKVVSIIKASLDDSYEVLAIHPGRMNTDMGKATSEIEADVAAQGIYEISTGQRIAENWYVDYNGKKMKS